MPIVKLCPFKFSVPCDFFVKNAGPACATFIAQCATDDIARINAYPFAQAAAERVQALEARYGGLITRLG